MFTTKTNC